MGAARLGRQGEDVAEAHNLPRRFLDDARASPVRAGGEDAERDGKRRAHRGVRDVVAAAAMGAEGGEQ